MRSDYPQQSSTALIWVCCAFVAGFILEQILIQMGALNYLIHNIMLSGQALREYKLWTLLTYSTLHDPKNLLHLLFSLLGMYFMGKELLPVLGSWRFLTICSAFAVVSGLAWCGLHWTGGTLVGASGVLSGLFILYACLNPDRPITFLLLFIPVTLPKTRYLAWGFFALEVLGMAVFEFRKSDHMVAHSAHLGGMLAGFIYYQFALSNRTWSFRLPWRRKRQELVTPAWVANVASKSAATPAFQLNLSEREHLKMEVDRILDKINSQGFGSLTPAEKKTLDEARDMLSKH